MAANGGGCQRPLAATDHRNQCQQFVAPSCTLPPAPPPPLTSAFLLSILKARKVAPSMCIPPEPAGFDARPTHPLDSPLLNPTPLPIPSPMPFSPKPPCQPAPALPHGPPLPLLGPLSNAPGLQRIPSPSSCCCSAPHHEGPHGPTQGGRPGGRHDVGQPEGGDRGGERRRGGDKKRVGVYEGVGMKGGDGYGMREGVEVGRQEGKRNGDVVGVASGARWQELEGVQDRW